METGTVSQVNWSKQFFQHFSLILYSFFLSKKLKQLVLKTHVWVKLFTYSMSSLVLIDGTGEGVSSNHTNKQKNDCMLSCHVRVSEEIYTLSCLNVKELLAHNRCNIWSLFSLLSFKTKKTKKTFKKNHVVKI